MVSRKDAKTAKEAGILPFFAAFAPLRAASEDAKNAEEDRDLAFLCGLCAFACGIGRRKERRGRQRSCLSLRPLRLCVRHRKTQRTQRKTEILPFFAAFAPLREHSELLTYSTSSAITRTLSGLGSAMLRVVTGLLRHSSSRSAMRCFGPHSATASTSSSGTARMASTLRPAR